MDAGDGSMRLRLTAYSLAGLQEPEHVRQHKHRGTAYARAALAHATADLTGFYDRVAAMVGRPVAGQVLLPVVVPAFTGLGGNGSAARAAEDSGVAVLSEAGDADGLEEGDGTDLVRVITAPHHPHLLWVAEHLQHLSSHAQAIADPAAHVAEQRRPLVALAAHHRRVTDHGEAQRRACRRGRCGRPGGVQGSHRTQGAGLRRVQVGDQAL